MEYIKSFLEMDENLIFNIKLKLFLSSYYIKYFNKEK